MGAAAQIEAVFRGEHGRVLAVLISQLGDFELAEDAPTAEATDWRQIAALYGKLAEMGPSMVVEVNRAVALGMAENTPEGLQVGLQMLMRLDGEADGYYPYHAARADLLRRANQPQAAAKAYRRAFELCGNRAERAYLHRRLEEMLILEGN
ncbi:MAG: hypothetical protein A2W35_05235 [Chloroflexi bacterium RBG_16_57_11]|nr:MAG: hypothetical protein A2W35_05235 [Chloroflexi bacterium RBG_16_57_11]